ncbi:MAG TPA: hypothetical protein VFL55_13675 [Acetobacteraceae bacterium]|nr:hypothetical protein [Acetobacteraceae bacterium]
MQISDAIPNLPAEIVRHGLETLIGILPRPIPDTPENLAAREASAIRAVAALRPRDAFQLMLAVQIVGTDAHAMECLRFAAVPGQPLDIVQRARSQACSLWRVSDASLRDLMRTQDRQDKSAATRPAARPARTPGAQAAAKRSGDPAKPPKLYLVH